MNIQERVTQELPEIAENLKTLVSYPSIKSEPLEGMPYGKANAEVLAKALSILDNYGFTTKNLDNHVGYGEVGQGEELIVLCGHLDVVPVTDGWTTDPFTLTMKDGNLYGRGATDDKGPVCCAIAAVRIVQEIRPELNKRIRIVMGCNEENGSSCLEYYVQKEGHPNYGFTPDGSFPGIHGEKGMIGGHINMPTKNIVSIEGGAAFNVVCGKVTFEVVPDSLDKGKFQMALHARNIQYDVDPENPWKYTVFGRQAHASTPDLGVNAILETYHALDEAGFDDPSVRFIARYFGLTCHGERLGIDFEDAYGDLSLNLGVIKKEDDKITCTVDIRYPVTKDPEQMQREYLKATEGDEDGEMVLDHIEKPLFYEPDSPLVQALYSAYKEVTKDEVNKPLVIGGGTYAKVIKNVIAFGAEFPDDPDIHMHGDDEFIPIKNLTRQTEIYVQAILNLLDL